MVNNISRRYVLAGVFAILSIGLVLSMHRYGYRVRQFNTQQQQPNQTTLCDWTDLEGVPFNANASDIDIGQTELEQYQRYVTLKPSRAGGSSDGYTYKVTLLGNRPASDGIFIQVEERLKGKPTSGGSSLTVYSEHLSKELCNYRDMFNGIYIVWCPPMVLGGRRDFIMKLQFVNFGAYAGGRVTLNRHLWHHQIKLYTQKPLAPIHRPDVTTALGERMNKKNTVIWYQRKERWFVKLANGDRFFSLSTSRMCACVRSMNRLIMAGASHMRYKFDYIVQTCYNPGGNFPKLQRHKNLIFVPLQYAEDSLKSLMSTVGKLKLTGMDMLFVQSGSWNLAFRGLKRMMDSSIKSYVDALLAVRTKTGIPRANLVVVTEPPFAMHESVTHASGDRNNYCIAAAMRKLKSILRVHDFNIYDEFAIIQPQSENDICAVHYICPVFDGRNYSVYGEIGITSAKLMIAHACRGHDTLVTPCP